MALFRHFLVLGSVSGFELLSRHSDARDPALTADALRRATQLLTKLQRNEGAVGAPAQAAERPV